MFLTIFYMFRKHASFLNNIAHTKVQHQNALNSHFHSFQANSKILLNVPNNCHANELACLEAKQNDVVSVDPLNWKLPGFYFCLQEYEKAVVSER